MNTFLMISILFRKAFNPINFSRLKRHFAANNDKLYKYVGDLLDKKRFLSVSD